MALKPTIIRNQVKTTTVAETLKFLSQMKCEQTERHNEMKQNKWMPDEKAFALVAKLRLNCCKRLLDQMEDKTSPEGVVFAVIIMEAKAALQALR